MTEFYNAGTDHLMSCAMHRAHMWRTLHMGAVAVFVVIAISGTCQAQDTGFATLSVSPAYAYITAQEPYGAFRLRNEGTVSMEVIVSAQYGVIEADSVGENTRIVTGRAGLVGDLTDRLIFYPERAILEPGTEQVVRFMIEGAAALPDGGYITLMHYKMQERAAVGESAIPAVATAISIEYSLVAPLVLFSGPIEPVLSTRVLGITDSTLTLLLANSTSYPFIGGVSAVKDGRSLGRILTAVYSRRRIEIPLSAPLGESPFTVAFDTDFPGISPYFARSTTPPAKVQF